MKMFKVQAICADVNLWEVMRCLEESKCVGILTQPMLDEDDEVPSKRNGKHYGKTNLREGSLQHTALQIVRDAGGPIKAADVGKMLSAKLGRHIKPHGVLFILNKHKLIRSKGSGRYVATKHEAA